MAMNFSLPLPSLPPSLPSLSLVAALVWGASLTHEETEPHASPVESMFTAGSLLMSPGTCTCVAHELHMATPPLLSRSHVPPLSPGLSTFVIPLLVPS